MGCDFWIDTEEDAPSVVTRMTGIQPSWATTKGEIFRTRPHNAIPGKVIPGKFFKQNLWELSGTAYFEKDDHLIPFKSIDMLEMIEKQKSSFQKIFRNYKYKCLLHFCYVNRHKLQFRIPPELWKRIAPYGLLVDFDLYLLSKSKKNNINRIKAGTEMGCTLYIETGKNDPDIVTELRTGIARVIRIRRIAVFCVIVLLQQKKPAAQFALPNQMSGFQSFIEIQLQKRLQMLCFVVF